MKNNIRLEEFEFEGNIQKLKYIETSNVTNGAVCDVYKFVEDSTKDLGVIKIDAGKNTPLQKVLNGDRTIEGYISGKGKLVITDANGNKTEYQSKSNLVVEVKIGEQMQWFADNESNLIAYEICFPPYKDGRYQNL